MTAYVKTQGGALNLRQAASTSSKVLAQIPQGTKIEVETIDNTWSKTTYGNKTGYVMTKYLSMETSTATSTFNKADLESIYNSLKTTLSLIEKILK